MSSCLLNFYAVYTMQNAGLDEAQAGIKIAGRNNNNLRHTDHSTLTVKSKEQLKGLLVKMKEESEKGSLNLNIGKTKIMASGLIASWQIDGEKVETVSDFIFLGSRISLDSDCGHEIKRHLILGRIAMSNPDSVLKSRHHFDDKGPYSQTYGFCSSHVWM